MNSKVIIASVVSLIVGLVLLFSFNMQIKKPVITSSQEEVSQIKKPVVTAGEEENE